MMSNRDIVITADGLWELVWHLFQWRGEIIPVSPASLVETYKEFLDKCQKSINS